MHSSLCLTHPFRRPSAAALSLVLALGLGACGRSVQVRTVAAPNANFTGRRTFRILPTPAPAGVTLAATDPMLTSSITYEAIRDELRTAFEARGDRYSETRPDLEIAYYATAAPVLDLRTFNYGYDWRGFPREYTEVYQYEEGAVIVDVIDAVTHQLLWRGEGRAPVSTDPAKYAKELRKAADEIVKRFPAATG
jgi:hypothetical protein